MNNPLLTEAIGVYLIDMDTAVEEQVNYNEDGSACGFDESGKCTDFKGNEKFREQESEL